MASTQTNSPPPTVPKSLSTNYIDVCGVSGDMGNPENGNGKPLAVNRPGPTRCFVSSHLLFRVASRRIAIRYGEVLKNAGGKSPKGREQIPPDGAPKSRDGAASSLDLALAYSNHLTTGRRAPTLQNRLTIMARSPANEDPAIRAAREALLETHRTHVRELLSVRSATR